MSFPPAPFKTPLGIDELRHRTRGLGQRHRTVLLLVDGHRALGEVLGMAKRAGASTSHFEELVRLGMVHMPVEHPPAPQETAPGDLDRPKLTSVEVEVHAEPMLSNLFPEPDGEAVGAVHDDGPETVGNPDVEPIPELPVEEPEPPPALPLPKRAAWLQFRDPTDLADHARPRSPTSEEQLLHQARSLLVGAIGAEAALLSPLILTRIRAAQTARELIAIVWDIERQRHHMLRNRAQLFSLEKARELLGMGNTLVSGDTRTGGLWPDTRGA